MHSTALVPAYVFRYSFVINMRVDGFGVQDPFIVAAVPLGYLFYDRSVLVVVEGVVFRVAVGQAVRAVSGLQHGWIPLFGFVHRGVHVLYFWLYVCGACGYRCCWGGRSRGCYDLRGRVFFVDWVFSYLCVEHVSLFGNYVAFYFFSFFV